MRLVPALLLSLHCLSASAALFRDNALQQAYEQARLDELATLGQTRGGAEGLAAQALGQALANDAGALERARQAAQDCVARHPEQAACHYAQATVLGLDALRGGWLGGLRVIGRLKGALEQSLLLDPQLFEARNSLQQLLLALPVGGSISRARELVQELPEGQAEQAKLLRANLAAKDKRWDEVERELLSVRPGESRVLQHALLEAWTALARQWLKLNQHGHALARLEALARQLPARATPVYLLARNAADAGRHEEALRLYERARTLEGADALPLDLRVGIAHQDLGQTDKARAALQRATQQRQATPKNVEDAQRRLRQLGGA